MKCTTRKRLPPYGKELQARLRRGDVPDRGVWVYTGPHAWEWSRTDPARPYYWVGEKEDGCRYAWGSPELEEIWPGAELAAKRYGRKAGEKHGVELGDYLELPTSSRQCIDSTNLPSVLIHPPGEDPWTFFWPVEGCRVILRPSCTPDTEKLGRALLWHGAACVLTRHEIFYVQENEPCPSMALTTKMVAA